jgi:hypothetical protein
MSRGDLPSNTSDVPAELQSCYVGERRDLFDPDIAGVGVCTESAIKKELIFIPECADHLWAVKVVAAFLATAIMTIIGICVGYFRNCLPGIEHTEIDHLLVTRFRRILRLKKTPAELAAIKVRYEGPTERFLLSLADQQLVTSLAIILAAFIAWRRISLYSFNMAFSMAIASLVTHLATLRFCPR